MGLPSRIGIDLDNTIIDYGPAIPLVAAELGYPPQMRDRASIRRAYRASATDDDEWQRFQAALYTTGLRHADVAKGLTEFLGVCRRKGIHVVVVSHKTERTPARFGARDLRGPARDWLDIRGISPGYVDAADVHFCGTRAEKIQAIAASGIELFVDDLAEVLRDPAMPPSIEPVWYRTGEDRMADDDGGAAPLRIADFEDLGQWLRGA